MHALSASVTTAADERAPRFFKHAWILASPAGGSLTRQVLSEQLQVGFYSGCRKPVPMRGKYSSNYASKWLIARVRPLVGPPRYRREAR
jgi:hypothetical protein